MLNMYRVVTNFLKSALKIRQICRQTIRQKLMNIINKWTNFFSNQNIRNSKAAWYQVMSSSFWPCESPEIFTTRSWCILRPIFSGHTWLWDPISRNCFGKYPMWANFVNIELTVCENQILSNTHTPPHTHTPCITHRYEVLMHKRGRKWAEVFLNKQSGQVQIGKQILHEVSFTSLSSEEVLCSCSMRCLRLAILGWLISFSPTWVLCGFLLLFLSMSPFHSPAISHMQMAEKFSCLFPWLLLTRVLWKCHLLTQELIKAVPQQDSSSRRIGSWLLG